jgi:hypothetical protein
MYRLHLPDSPKGSYCCRVSTCYLTKGSVQKISTCICMNYVIMSQHWYSGSAVIVVKLIERPSFCYFVFQRYKHYGNKICTFIGYLIPTKISWPLSKSKAPSPNLKYWSVRHVVIADCTKLNVWQLRDFIWHNVHTDVQEHGETRYGDTPTATHQHAYSHSPTHLQLLTNTPTATHQHTYSHSPTHLQPLTNTPTATHRHAYSHSPTRLQPFTNTPTATHQHTHRPIHTREHKTHTTCLENLCF